MKTQTFLVGCIMPDFCNSLNVRGRSGCEISISAILQMAGSEKVVFAVRSLQIDYLAPAIMDDLLDVETRVTNIRGASLEFQQRIMRGAYELAKVTVQIAAICNDRPTRIPAALRRVVDLEVRGS